MSTGRHPGDIPSAAYYRRESDYIICELCPHQCVLKDSATGRCGVRGNSGGDFAIPGWGLITAASSDPIEKKPLYHFYPGDLVWSIGFNGCNLRCPFCQNDSISRPGRLGGSLVSPTDMVQTALASGSRMIAYTYSEPTVHIEYLIEASEMAHEAGLLNVLVTNGNILEKPSMELLQLTDAVNIDLKSWDNLYYRRTLGGDLKTVMQFIELALERSWVEITTLIVPDDNDSPGTMRELSSWIASFSRAIPLHLSAYHPASSYQRPPTTPESLFELAKAARDNLDFVYIGNLGIENDTVCPVCGSTVIHRRRFSTTSNLENGCCPKCETIIPGIFPE